MHTFRSLVLLALLSSFRPAFAQQPVELELVPWAQGLSAAVDITHCGDGRLFVVRQWGRISIVTDSMQNAPTPFLDISTQIIYNGERGLLGMAFDPDYANNGFFYVNYVANVGANGTTRISRFSVSSGNPNVADPASEVVLLSLPQPDPIHNGGGLVFGTDGYLYCALGDGGGAGDPNGTGQTTTDLFGCVLRIKPEPDSTYSIPPDNPFVGSPNGERAEIWAYGLRNPYRIAIDPANGDLWIGDVGQQFWEEIDRWPGGDNSGPNFGWSCYEGNDYFNSLNCTTGAVFQPPLVVQAHSVNGGNFCAVVGGEVYHGALYPRLQGRFVYTDYCTGGVRTLTPDGNGGYVDQLGAPLAFFGNSSVGTDVNGELYITNVSQGRVYKVKDKCPMDAPTITPDGNDLIATEGASYEWLLEGQPFPDGNTQIIYAWATGNYVVRVTYANGCVKESAPYFHLSTGVLQHPDRSLRVVPTPASTEAWLELPAGSVDVVLRDASGRIVLRERAPSSARMSVDVSALSVGSYLVEVASGSGAVLQRGRLLVAR